MQVLKTVLLATTIAVVAATTAAGGPIVMGVGQSVMVGLNGSTGDISQGADSFLSATARFTVTSWSGRSVTFTVDVANTSSTAAGYASRITALGFDLDPEELEEVSVSGAFAKAVTDDTMRAHGLPKLLDGSTDVCLKNGRSRGCESGTDGIAQGTTGSSVLTLTFASLPTSIAFDDFFVRYQGIDTPEARGMSAAGIATCVDEGCGDGDRSVPEPTMLALLGAGLFGAGYMRRRGRR